MKIFDETDVLIAPSIWYETFAYTVVEALSYGVPVIVTKNVGAKDVIPNGAGLVIDDISPKGIKDAIKSLKSEKLAHMNQIILASKPMMEMREMVARIYTELYQFDDFYTH
ncbi:MAG: glycosyltransferase [Candidatus Gastranaerophilales bacterium]|nr:glycosyltransferase [Candidatus Gastranaerophilales bacterium]